MITTGGTDPASSTKFDQPNADAPEFDEPDARIR